MVREGPVDVLNVAAGAATVVDCAINAARLLLAIARCALPF
jgi:hypothetical protein